MLIIDFVNAVVVIDTYVNTFLFRLKKTYLHTLKNQLTIEVFYVTFSAL